MQFGHLATLCLSSLQNKDCGLGLAVSGAPVVGHFTSGIVLRTMALIRNLSSVDLVFIRRGEAMGLHAKQVSHSKNSVKSTKLGSSLDLSNSSTVIQLHLCTIHSGNLLRSLGFLRSHIRWLVLLHGEQKEKHKSTCLTQFLCSLIQGKGLSLCNDKLFCLSVTHTHFIHG